MANEERDLFEAEARRRGLGVSTTIRALALERATELREQRQIERARQWQTRRMRAAVDAIDGGQNPEVDQADIDALFDDPAGPQRRRRKT
jgi:hypothetical protein